MSVNRLNTRFRERNDIIDNITPKNVVQRDISAPHGPWKPASWLPIQFVKHNTQVGDSPFVISSGKVVALDTESRLVPAGMKMLLKGGAGSLVYTALDAEWGVTNLVTGQPVAGPVSYSSIQVAAALVERGLVLAEDAAAGSGAVPPTTQTHADLIVDIFISPPVGVAVYDMNVWSGLPEDGDQHYTNLSWQHAVQFQTEAQMQVPHFVAGAVADDAFVVATLNSGGSETYAAGTQVGAGEYWNAANVSQLTRYAPHISATSPVVALGLDPEGDGTQHRIARVTDRTPFEVDTAGVLVRQRKSPGDIKREGDWYLDAELGVLFLHSDTWATGVAATATWEFSYHYYDTDVTDAHRHVHFDGPVYPGRRVTYDDQSNFVMATSSTDEEDILGRTLMVQVQPLPLLDAVKTGFPGATSATARMPGSATKGFTDLITLSQEVVADQVVIMNIRI